jgi:hypothetical protein
MAIHKAALIITFARTQGVIRILSSAIMSGVTTVYIAIDGPRDKSHVDLQIQMLKEIRHYVADKNIDVKLWHRDTNLGVAASIITAIDWFFSNEEQGVILEDDLIAEPDFFDFCFEALDFYKSDELVWSISGSRMNPENGENPITEWSNYPMIWGWATWSNRWKEMRSALLIYPKPTFYNLFDKKINYWYLGAMRANQGLVDTWDLPLAYIQSQLGLFTVIPTVNLVSNLGFDEHAAHTSGQAFPLSHPIISLNDIWSFSKKPDSEVAKKYDYLLDRNLYKISFRHKFLRIYAPILDFYHSKSHASKGDLAFRLSKVSLPTSNYNPINEA